MEFKNIPKWTFENHLFFFQTAALAVVKNVTIIHADVWPVLIESLVTSLLLCYTTRSAHHGSQWCKVPSSLAWTPILVYKIPSLPKLLTYIVCLPCNSHVNFYEQWKSVKISSLKLVYNPQFTQGLHTIGLPLQPTVNHFASHLPGFTLQMLSPGPMPMSPLKGWQDCLWA